MKTDEFSNVIMIFGMRVKFWVRKYPGWKILKVERKKEEKKNAKKPWRRSNLRKIKCLKNFFFFYFFRFLTEMSTSECAFSKKISDGINVSSFFASDVKKRITLLPKVILLNRATFWSLNFKGWLINLYDFFIIRTQK